MRTRGNELGVLDLDLDVDAGREVEALERVDRLGRGIEDVEQALVDAHLAVLARVLVLMTVKRCFSVGNGIGPRTDAWVRVTVSTIFLVDWSMTSWSYAFRRMRIFWSAAMAALSLLVRIAVSAPGRHGRLGRTGSIDCQEARPADRARLVTLAEPVFS